MLRMRRASLLPLQGAGLDLKAYPKFPSNPGAFAYYAFPNRGGSMSGQFALGPKSQLLVSVNLSHKNPCRLGLLLAPSFCLLPARNKQKNVHFSRFSVIFSD